MTTEAVLTYRLAAAQSDVAAALAAARPLVDRHVSDTPTGRVVSDFTGHDTPVVTHLERYDQAPARGRGTITTLTAAGFTLAVQQRLLDNTCLYADLQQHTLEAVLNDDLADAPGWRDWRVRLAVPRTLEWEFWLAGQGPVALPRFAAIIEEGQDEITSPAPSLMLEVAQNLNIAGTVKFKQAKRLAGGKTQLVYDAEDTATSETSAGTITLPEEMTLNLAPFFDGPMVSVRCRIRYERTNGELRIGYTIHRSDHVELEAFSALAQAVADGLGHELVAGQAGEPVPPIR